MSSDNSSSARAARAKLQAELAEAQQNLQDQYYERSISNQTDALDKELENFQDTKDKEIESLEEYLENTNQVVADSLATIQANTDVVYQTLMEMGQEYGLSITESLTSPWQEGENAIQSFSEKFGISMSATVDELRQLEIEFKQTMLEIEKSGVEAVENVKKSADKYTKAEYTEPKEEEKPKDEPAKEEEKTIKIGSKINAGNALIYGWEKDKSGSRQYFSDDPIYVVLDEANNRYKVRWHKAKSGVTGWFNKSDVKPYAKGTTGVKKDQLALIDELGEELVINVQNGKLKYMSKGSGVIPADFTSNLMDWGAINPQDMLDRNRPSTGVTPSIINNNMEFKVDASIGTLLKIDEFNGDDPDEVLKMINKALDQHTKNLNNALRRYTR